MQQFNRKRSSPPSDDTPKRWSDRVDVLQPALMVHEPGMDQCHVFAGHPEVIHGTPWNLRAQQQSGALIKQENLQHVGGKVQDSYFYLPGTQTLDVTTRYNTTFGSTASSSTQSTPASSTSPTDVGGSFQQMPMHTNFQPETTQQNKENEFCKVPGRLAMVGNQTKYSVSIDELRRRCQPPESFKSSEMSSLLRKAKTKDGGQEMRNDLKAHGIVVVTNKRQGFAKTMFSSLTEGEATAMALDLDSLLSHCFPVQAIADNLAKHIVATSPNLHQAYNYAHAVTAHLFSLNNLLVVQPPVTGLKKCESADAALNDGLKLCSLVTHGFSDVAQRAFGKAFLRVFAELERNLYLKLTV